MIREYNFHNNNLNSTESSPVIEITHFDDENEVKKKETYSVGYFLMKQSRKKLNILSTKVLNYLNNIFEFLIFLQLKNRYV